MTTSVVVSGVEVREDNNGGTRGSAEETLQCLLIASFDIPWFQKNWFPELNQG